MKKNILGKLLLIIFSLCFIILYFVRFTAKEEQANVESYKTAVEVQKVQFGNIEKIGENIEDILVISKNALIRESEGNYVFSVKGNTVSKVKVEVGMEDNENVEITSGVRKDDEVVVKGKEFVKDGEEVNVVGGND